MESSEGPKKPDRQGDAVLFHAPCIDGAVAAWVFWRAFGGGDAVYVPVNYGKPLPIDPAQFHRVFIVDFSFPPEVMRAAALAAPDTKFTVLDHHASAEAGLRSLGDLPNVEVVFDHKRSGAWLAWRFFNQLPDKVMNNVELVPELVRYADDGDRWQFKEPCSREVRAYLRVKGVDRIDGSPASFDLLDAVQDTLMRSPHIAFEIGEACMALEARMVANAVAAARPCRLSFGLMYYPCRVVNAASLQSEIGHAMAAGATIGVIWFYDYQDRKFRVSLRSAEDGPDVSAIAKWHGGGGHPHAAGFEVESFAQLEACVQPYADGEYYR